MKKILIIKAGSSLPQIVIKYGDFENWIMNLSEINRSEFFVVNVSKYERLPDFSKVNAVFITGSHSNVTERLPWMDITAEWLLKALDENLPTLGICFGHQLLAYANGGLIGDNHAGHEAGIFPVTKTEAGQNDPLFGPLPESFAAALHHRQCVLKIPESTVKLSWSELDAIQVLRYNSSAYGIQFHPEFNFDVIREYLINDGISNEMIPFSRISLSWSSSLIKRFLQTIVFKD